MVVLNFPDNVKPSSVSWHLMHNTDSFKSPFTGSVKTRERMGAHWVATLTFSNLEQDETADFEAFITQLRGQAGRFWIHDHSKQTRGTWGSSPKVRGANQLGNTLVIDGVTTSSTCAKKGDRISVNGEYKVISEDASSSGGIATIQFEPPLRYAPPDNAVIVVNNALCYMKLTDDKQGKMSTRTVISSTTLNIEEAF